MLFSRIVLFKANASQTFLQRIKIKCFINFEIFVLHVFVLKPLTLSYRPFSAIERHRNYKIFAFYQYFLFHMATRFLVHYVWLAKETDLYTTTLASYPPKSRFDFLRLGPPTHSAL